MNDKELEQLRLDAKRYQWIKQNITQDLTDECKLSVDCKPLKTKFVIPEVIAFAEFCGDRDFDFAIDQEIYKSGLMARASDQYDAAGILKRTSVVIEGINDEQ